ncbi:MAG: hypothetical protein KAQ98_06300 [Bacteriovoracaceae bacterium]|nr:hypothetical protein [Bacteriovoracaceae bacterium]
MKKLFFIILIASSICSYAVCDKNQQLDRGYDIQDKAVRTYQLAGHNVTTILIAVDYAIENAEKSSCDTLKSRLDAIEETISDLLNKVAPDRTAM